MEARDREDVREAVNGADLVTPDGMPLVWLLRHRDVAGQTRVYGPNLTVQLCEAAAGSGVPVGFYGGRPDAVARLIERLTTDFPDLRVTYAASPPFRELSLDEDEQVTAAINASKTRVLFVGLGCPKQERWMAAHRGRIRSVMLGVGAAFDFVSGMKAQAPIWMQSAGLEWLFRLATEPRRLCRRYVIGNTRFLFHVALEECRSAAGDWSRRTGGTEGRSTENH
jgi:N-acetylglucosaminyldiphosphoundecaprenol N-acetyl-beta-D-mannosaminyltransferase